MGFYFLKLGAGQSDTLIKKYRFKKKKKVQISRLCLFRVLYTPKTVTISLKNNKGSLLLTGKLLLQ